MYNVTLICVFKQKKEVWLFEGRRLLAQHNQKELQIH